MRILRSATLGAALAATRCNPDSSPSIRLRKAIQILVGESLCAVSPFYLPHSASLFTSPFLPHVEVRAATTRTTRITPLRVLRPPAVDLARPDPVPQVPDREAEARAAPAVEAAQAAALCRMHSRPRPPRFPVME